MIAPRRTIALALAVLLLLAGCGGGQPDAVPTAQQAVPSAILVPTALPASPTLPPPSPTVPPATPTAPQATPTASPSPVVPYEAALRITYVCNDGFIIEYRGKKILADVLFWQRGNPCSTDSERLAAMTSALPPFDGADLVLVSHDHPDHFEASTVGAYLRNNPRAVLVSMPAVSDALQKGFPGFGDVRGRVRGIQPSETAAAKLMVAGIEIEAVSAPADVPNLGFLIQIDGITVLHLGDSGNNTDAMNLLRPYRLPEKRIDVAMVPWWYIGDEFFLPLVDELVRAGTYVPMHFAGRDAQQAFKAVSTYYPRAVVLRKEMETWAYVPPAPPATTATRTVARTTTPAPAAAEPANAIVERLVAVKLAAMKDRDIVKYLSLINEADPEYYTEQRNWFLIYQDAVTADFSIEVVKADKVNDGTIVASLRQRYLYGAQRANRSITYEQRFVMTPAGWKDADLNFASKETPHFAVKYQSGIEDKAAEFAEEAERAHASVVSALGLDPVSKTTIKLYADQEMLRQSSDIRVAYLFNGWAEDGESIKFYARRDRSAMAPVIAHELVHKLTLAVSDSQCSWLAEGLANYYGSQPFRDGDPIKLGTVTAGDLAQPLAWLEAQNLTQLTDEKAIKIYYAMSSMVVQFIATAYGAGGPKALLAELAKNPRYDRGHDYSAMETENQRRLHQAIQAALGVDMDTFNRRWLDWIGARKT